MILDPFSRRLWAKPTKSKSASEVFAYIKSVMDNLDVLPKSVITDEGRELVNRQFQSYLDSKGIHFYHPTSEIKVAHVERANRRYTCKKKIFFLCV